MSNAPQRPTDRAVIRLPQTSKARKKSYLRAARGEGLAAWVFRVLDAAAGHREENNPQNGVDSFTGSGNVQK